MKIGIIGAGKVGCSLGRYFVEQGLGVSGYSSKTKESVETAATFTNTRAYDSLYQLVSENNLIFITTPDDCISEVWAQIVQYDYNEKNKIICHFSGSLSSDVFLNREKKGFYACSFHPMYAFSDKFTSYKQLNQVMFTAEGDKEALAELCPLLERLGNPVFVIKGKKKERYHAAASLISNMMIGLYQMGIDMLVDCGFSETEAKCLVKPLVEGNIQNLLHTSPEQALTGPIERGDVETIKKHLAQLTDREHQVYIGLGRTLTEVARRKNPHKDYAVIEELLRGDKSQEAKKK